MKRIEAIIRPIRFEAVKEALNDIGVYPPRSTAESRGSPIASATWRAIHASWRDCP
ncbi:MAG: hypothetical protein KatS3mg016_1540 [Fimbriimonadales bacterium]|nr:MAG: hypothetical protein KatS3mg016_1540 [Fimbriimonadales bacterium]